MSQHTATLAWKCTSPDFLKGRYSREHTWTFDGGFTVPGSSSPSVVPVPYSNPSHVDPEEAFIASVSSCHLLTFLYLASRQGFEVSSYEDHAVGVMTKNERGVPWISSITLNPTIVYGGNKLPTAAEEEHLHHLAHEECFIANSIKTQVTVSAIRGPSLAPGGHA
jgi:organic hydroperoxide reductase OsmC/OhrA